MEIKEFMTLTPNISVSVLPMTHFFSTFFVIVIWSDSEYVVINNNETTQLRDCNFTIHMVCKSMGTYV